MRTHTRMSKSQKLYYEYLDRYLLSDLTNPTRSFKLPQPLGVELGFGDGHILKSTAECNRHWNFIGVDVFRPGIATLVSNLIKSDIKNVKLVKGEALTTIQALPDSSISRLWVLFPDPWPKKKHHKRRLITPTFVNTVAQKLKVGAEVHLASDWPDYQQEIHMYFGHSPHFYGGEVDRPNRYVSKYEGRAIRLGYTNRYYCFTLADLHNASV